MLNLNANSLSFSQEPLAMHNIFSSRYIFLHSIVDYMPDAFVLSISLS